MPYRNISVFSLMVLFSLVLMVDSQKNLLLLLLLTVTLLYVYDQQVIFAAVFVAFFVRFLVVYEYKIHVPLTSISSFKYMERQNL